MGRKSKEHRNNRRSRAVALEMNRIQKLETELMHRSDGDAQFWAAPDCPPEMRRAGLEEVLAFEAVESGITLFEGLQAHGIALPGPETLDERGSAAKIEQIIFALLELQVILIGFEKMSVREFYATLWHETLWEGCYIENRLPGAVTIIDVSHSIPQSEILKHLEAAVKASVIH